MVWKSRGERISLFALFVTALLIVSLLSISDEARLGENGQDSAGTDNNEPSDIQQSAALGREPGDGIPFSCGVRSSGENTTNATMVMENVRWGIGDVTLTPGNQTKPGRIETGEMSAIVYKLPNTINVSHLDLSGNETYDGQTFYRNFTVPVDITMAVYPNTTLEMGYVGEYNYSDRDDDGNPIQDTLHLQGTVIKGFVISNVMRGEGKGHHENGSRGTGDNESNPLIEILSRFNGSEEVGIVCFNIPAMNASSSIFRAGINDDGEAEVVAFEGALDVEVKDIGEEGPFSSCTLEPVSDASPQGVHIANVSEDFHAEVERVDVYHFMITGAVDYSGGTGAPPFFLDPVHHKLYLDPDRPESMEIEGYENYTIEIVIFNADGEETQFITLSGIEPGGVDKIKIDEDSISIRTTSEEEKTIDWEIKQGNETYEFESTISKGEENKIGGLGEGHHYIDPIDPVPIPIDPPGPDDKIIVPEKDDDDEFVIAGMNGYLFMMGLGLPLLIMVIAVVAILLDRKKRKPPIEAPQETPDTDSEAEYMPQEEGKEPAE